MDKFKILIVEDDENILKIIDTVLDETAFEKKAAMDGKEALRTYEEWNPDVIVLDIMLPVMTGFSFLKEVRQHINDTKTPIIMTTGVSKKETVMECMSLGVQGYIVKPFKPETILQRICECCHETYPDRAAQAGPKLAPAP
ncbi:MAG: response regulator [Deltaproteobacteria bacterium]|nr:response regulator [Deltaproteobacteria bacterium]